jgi:hypothetical protein
MHLVCISRADAAAKGLNRYFTGVPCIAGHLAERYVVNTRCEQCAALARKKHRAEKADHIRASRAEYRKKRAHVEREQERKRRALNPKAARDRTQKWRAKNREKLAAASRAKWPERRAREMRRKRERYAADPLYALKSSTRNRISASFRRMGFGKRSKTGQIVGCDWAELKRHIERQFLKGMDWSNRGTVWHIDHILPIASANSEEELIALCHFTNLRPLWALNNLQKHAKRTHLI